MFLDHLQLEVSAGKGGAGATAFRRDKTTIAGGPDGGDGGAGGSVYLKANDALNTLNSFRNTRKFEAGKGDNGAGGLKKGKDGADVVIEVPLGTLIKDAESGEPLAELMTHGRPCASPAAVAAAWATGTSRARRTARRAITSPVRQAKRASSISN